MESNTELSSASKMSVWKQRANNRWLLHHWLVWNNCWSLPHLKKKKERETWRKKACIFLGTEAQTNLNCLILCLLLLTWLCEHFQSHASRKYSLCLVYSHEYVKVFTHVLCACHAPVPVSGWPNQNRQSSLPFCTEWSQQDVSHKCS